MRKITRISYNSADWQRPTGDARKYEASATYNHKNGFGHEDWLFRNEWLIDDWRYAFVQGVNKSQASLLKAGEAIDLTLFAIQPDRKRRFVATIGSVECLDHQQAQDALDVFKERGWYSNMREEIQAVDGNVSAFGDIQWAKDILNVRFRLANVYHFPPQSYADADGPLKYLTRYQLHDAEPIFNSLDIPSALHKAGTTSLPKFLPFLRRGSAPVECTPEHARMQEKLMKELQVEYPQGTILREQDYIDVSVQTEQELILYEIKSDIEPRSVIRQALGQILEYAYHPSRTHSLPIRLVIVGRGELSSLDEAYLHHLKTEFALPLDYRVVKP